MSKIRNSLGVFVLPIPEEEMTWEQYKAKYGIDLASSLGLQKTTLGTYLLSFSRKIIYLDDPTGEVFTPPLTPAFAPDVLYVKNDDDETIGKDYYIPYMSYSHNSEALVLIGELRIRVYYDPETPNTIFYTEV